MNPEALRSFARKLFGMVLAVAAISALLYAAAPGTETQDRSLSYMQAIAVVSLIAITAWSSLAVRAQIRRQDQPIIEQLPLQPGDARPGGRSGVSASRSGSAQRMRELLVFAPDELTGLHAAVRAATSSRTEYRERLEPLLRRTAGDRAAREGRQVDIDGLVDIERRLPPSRGLEWLLIQIPGYRRKALTRAIVAVIRDIEEI